MGNLCSAPQNNSEADYALFAAAGGVDSSGIPSYPGKRWDETFPPYTREALQQKRERFWATRLEGRKEMWQALKMASEMEDADTARQIRESSGLTHFSRNSVSSVYCFDELGNRYEIPMYVIHDPENLLPPGTDPKEVDLCEKAPRASESSNEQEGELVDFRVRFSDNTKDVKLRAENTLTVLELKEVIMEERGFAIEAQRIFFSGRQLQSQWTLEQVGLHPGSVLQAFVKEGGAAP